MNPKVRLRGGPYDGNLAVPLDDDGEPYTGRVAGVEVGPWRWRRSGDVDEDGRAILDFEEPKASAPFLLTLGIISKPVRRWRDPRRRNARAARPDQEE